MDRSKLIKEYYEIDLLKMSKPDFAEENDYRSVQAMLQEMKPLFNQICGALESNSLPEERGQKLEQLLNTFNGWYKEAAGLHSGYAKGTVSEKNQKYRKFVEGIRLNYNSLFSSGNFEHQLTQSILYALSTRDFDITTKSTELEDLKDNYSKEVRRSKELNDQLSDSLKKSNLENYAKVFTDTAKRFSMDSWIWLAASVLLGGALIWMVIELFLNPAKLTSYEHELFYYMISGRILIVAIGLLFIGLCLKQFTLNRKQYVRNHHRANSISTYKSFIDSLSEVSDEDSKKLKNLLMVEVGKVIFDNSDHVDGKEGSRLGITLQTLLDKFQS